eukprot:gene10986-12149_t
MDFLLWVCVCLCAAVNAEPITGRILEPTTKNLSSKNALNEGMIKTMGKQKDRLFNLQQANYSHGTINSAISIPSKDFQDKQNLFSTRITPSSENISSSSNYSFTRVDNSSCSNSTFCETFRENSTTKISLSLSDKLGISAFSFIFVVGIFGNSFVCYTFGYKCRRRRTVTETLILYLAIADLIASFFNPLLYIYWIATGFRQWHFGIIGCKILPPIAPISTTISAAIIILICIDRYRSIVTPFKTRLSITQINIFAIMLVATSVLSYTFYLVKLDVIPGMTCLSPDIADKGYTIPLISFTLVFDIVYMAIFVPSYIRIFYQLRANDATTAITTDGNSRRKGTRRVLRTLFTVGVVFALLVFPRDIAQLVYAFSWMFPPGLPRSNALVTLNYWLKILHVSNSCANVFIYSHLHDNFKREMKMLFVKIFKRRGFSGEESDVLYRNTSVDHTDHSTINGRTNSLLDRLSFRGKLKSKKRRSLDGEISTESSGLIKHPTEQSSSNRLKSKPRGSPKNQSPLLQYKAGNITFSAGVMKRLEDAYPTPVVYDNGTSGGNTYDGSLPGIDNNYCNGKGYTLFNGSRSCGQNEVAPTDDPLQSCKSENGALVKMRESNRDTKKPVDDNEATEQREQLESTSLIGGLGKSFLNEREEKMNFLNNSSEYAVKNDDFYIINDLANSIKRKEFDWLNSRETNC